MGRDSITVADSNFLPTLSLRHDDEAFGGIAIGLEGSVQEMLGGESTESRIHHVDVGERVDGESRLAQQSATNPALVFGRDNRSLERTSHGLRKRLETHRTR
jgi:hypothetical protein